MAPRAGIDQLCGNANAVAASPYAPLQDIAHAQLAPDLAHIDRLALVLEALVPSIRLSPPAMMRAL